MRIKDMVREKKEGARKKSYFGASKKKGRVRVDAPDTKPKVSRRGRTEEIDSRRSARGLSMPKRTLRARRAYIAEWNCQSVKERQIKSGWGVKLGGGKQEKKPVVEHMLESKVAG